MMLSGEEGKTRGDEKRRDGAGDGGCCCLSCSCFHFESRVSLPTLHPERKMRSSLLVTRRILWGNLWKKKSVPESKSGREKETESVCVMPSCIVHWHERRFSLSLPYTSYPDIHSPLSFCSGCSCFPSGS